jgi:SAM-dependent methyltransferase
MRVQPQQLRDPFGGSRGVQQHVPCDRVGEPLCQIGTGQQHPLDADEIIDSQPGIGDLVQQLLRAMRVSAEHRLAECCQHAGGLDLSDASVDAVLLLGPLYHLLECFDRVRALREARRVVRPGGPVFAAVTSRWAARLDGVVVERMYERFPEAA